jgi:integrase
MKSKITLRTVANAQKTALAKGPLYLWDTQLKGFGAYITVKGNVSWLIQKWLGGRGGKAARYVIGTSRNGMTLDEARKQAAIDLGDVAKGINVVARKRERRQALNKEVNTPGLLAAFEKYLKKKSTGNRYWIELEKSVRRAIAELGERSLLIAITKADIRKVIDNREGLSAQRNLFAAFRPFFAWCVDQDLIAVSPTASLASPKPVASRDRELKASEILVYWKASLAIPYPFGHYFRLLLLLAQRREEVAGIRIDEIDLDSLLWTIPGERTKNGKAHIVHLSDLALYVIKDALRCQQELAEKTKELHPESNCYFILTTNNRTPISGYSKAKKKLDEKMRKVIKEGDPKGQLKPFRIHDLRRTFASRLASLGIPTDVADRVLNHISGSSMSGVKGVYQRYEFLPERQKAMAIWDEFVRNLTMTDKSVRKAAPGVAEAA